MHGFHLEKKKKRESFYIYKKDKKWICSFHLLFVEHSQDVTVREPQLAFQH